MSGERPWQLSVWQDAIRAPFFSLGVHVDLHTPTLDLHLPGWTVQIGRNGYWGVDGRTIEGISVWLGGRVMFCRGHRWTGHTDNCDHIPKG